MNKAMIAKPPTIPPAMIPTGTGDDLMDVGVEEAFCIIAGVLAVEGGALVVGEGVTEDVPPGISSPRSTLVI